MVLFFLLLNFAFIILWFQKINSYSDIKWEEKTYIYISNSNINSYVNTLMVEDVYNLVLNKFFWIFIKKVIR